MAASSVLCAFPAAVSAVDSYDDEFTDLNQSQIVEAMGASWNLGNQLEASNSGTPSETAWGNPVIKKELIQTVKEAGFKSIRIPVSYLSYIGEGPNYTINAAWLNRVQEVIDYAVAEGLYVIMNIHGDGYYTVTGSWLLCGESEEDQVAIRAKYEAVWKQIAERFKDYDEHLIFESMNEEGANNMTNEAYENLNKYNQIFVDTVRQTGGNNAKRWLLVPGWYTNIDYTVGNYGFSIPTDLKRDASVPSDEQRIMISVHYYDPWDFCGDDTSGTYSQWGKDSNSKKAASYCNTEEYMEGQIKKVYDKFVTEGYPVVIGEYGCINKESSDPLSTYFRAYYCKTMCELSKKYGCVPVYWDNGAISNSFGLINRKTLEIAQPQIIDAIMSVYLTPAENINRFITFTSSLDEGCYTAETWYVFNTALANAESVLSNSGSDDEKCQEAYDALHKAYYSMVINDEYQTEKEIIEAGTDIADSSSIDATDKYIVSVADDLINIKLSKTLTIKFKVLSGSLSANDNVFILKPYSNINWDGWNDNFVKFSDCTYDSSADEYTVKIDTQKVLASYTGSSEANGINLYYAIEDSSPVVKVTYYTATMPAEHTHHYELTASIDSCNSIREYTCFSCKDVITETISSSHTWSSWTIVKEATCTEEGSQERECTVCGEKETKTVKAKGHSYANGVCTVCGAIDPNNPTTTTTKPTSNTIATKITTTADSKAAQAAKDKAAAKKAMKQAKITKLTVKSKAKKKITVSWKKVKKATGYQVQVSKKKNFKKIVFKKFTSKKKLTIKNSKIKSKKTYYVRVRAYATYKNANNKAIKVYSSWNKKLRKVKVK